MPAHDSLPPDAPEFARRHVNVADPRLGARALLANDEFFAPKERMLVPAPPTFVPGKYDAHGKWMDGWETRRKRVPGHDWCIVRLARASRVHGLEIDTRHFTGNFPPSASVDACWLLDGDPDDETEWTPLLAQVDLAGDARQYFAVDADRPVTHVRRNNKPHRGIARQRVYGVPHFDVERADADGLYELSAAVSGGTIVASNNEHYGSSSNLLLPGRGVDMGDGWETRRRREPGHDWCIIALSRPGTIDAIEVDTAHFKGNYPDRCSLQAALVTEEGTVESLVTQSMSWPMLMPEQPLHPDKQILFVEQVADLGPVSHVRFNIHPDGGVSRLRLRGRPA
jgi:allantoicase